MEVRDRQFDASRSKLRQPLRIAAVQTFNSFQVKPARSISALTSCSLRVDRYSYLFVFELSQRAI